MSTDNLHDNLPETLHYRPSVSVVADSLSVYTGKRITTVLMEYWRAVHAELMTHREFSRNAASSRAIPVKRMFELLEESTCGPVEWGLNQAGMQASEVVTDPRVITDLNKVWREAKDKAVESAKELMAMGIHKQIANRLLEPFQPIKVLVTSTEFNNFLWLRDHEAAQPDIAAVADLLRDELNISVPVALGKGDWHTPFWDRGYWKQSTSQRSLEVALKISASMSAQTSYRKVDDTEEKARGLFERLVGSDRKHASVFEHQATPLDPHTDGEEYLCTAPNEYDGLITHFSSKSGFGSGNFWGWGQYRQSIEGHVKSCPLGHGHGYQFGNSEDYFPAGDAFLGEGINYPFLDEDPDDLPRFRDEEVEDINGNNE